MTASQLKTKVFAKVEEKLNKLKSEKVGVQIKDVIEQSLKLQNLIVNYSDLIFVDKRAPAALVFSVNRSSHTIVIYQIRGDF